MLPVLKKLFLIASLVIALTVAILLQAIIVINTDIGQKQAQRIINGIIPGSITWDKLSISLMTGKVEIRNAVLAGADHAPIIQIEHCTADLSLKSALRGKLDIKDARLVKPVVLLGFDETGRLNLLGALGIHPEKKKKSDKPVKLPGFLVVRKCLLEKGRFGFFHQAGNFNMEIRDIWCSAGLNFKDENGGIQLTVGDGFVSIKSRRIDVNTLKLASSIRAGIAERLHLKLKTTGSDIAIQGDIHDLFINPHFDVNAAFSVSLAELRDILNVTKPLDGMVNGGFTAKGPVNNPSLSLTGKYSGGRILGSPIPSIQADVNMIDRIISIPGLKAYSGAGHVELQGSINMQKAYAAGFIKPGHDPDKISYQLTAACRQFDLRGIPGITANAQGSINSDISITGTGFAPGTASADLDMKASIMNFSLGKEPAPSGLNIQAKASISGGALQVSRFDVLFGRARIRAEGMYTAASKELQGAFSLFSPDIIRETASLGLNGSGGKLSLNGSLSGTIRRPVIVAALSGEMIRFRDITIGNVTFGVALDETGRISINRLALVNNESAVLLSAALHLFSKEGSGISNDAAISLDLEKFEVYPGDFDNRLSGHVSLGGHLEGTTGNPRGSLSISGTDLDLGFQKFNALKIDARFEDKKITFDPALITVFKGEDIRCKGWIGMDRSYDISLVSDPISFTHLQPIDTSSGLMGKIALDLSGKGSLENPVLQGTATLTEIVFRDTTYDTMLVRLDLKNHSAVIKGKLNFDFEGNYDISKKNFMVSALFDKTDLTPYLSAAGKKHLGGTVTGKIKAQGNAASLGRSDLNISLSQFELTDEGEQLVSARKFDAVLTKGAFQIPGIHLSLLNSGWVNVTGSGNLNSTIRVSVDSSIPLEVMNKMAKNLTNISGTLLVKGEMTGTWSEPHVDADIKLKTIGFSIPAISNQVQDLNGRITFTPGRVAIYGLEGAMGSGRFGMNGSFGLKGFRAHDIKLNAKASNILIDIPGTMNMTFDARARVTGDYSKAFIRGDFSLVEGTYYQDLVLHPLQDLGSTTVKKPKAAEEKTISRLLDSILLDITVKNIRPFTIDNNIAKLKINTNMKIIGSLRTPLLSGSAWVDNGVVHYLGRDFTITRGKIDFINPYRIEPQINISSTARIQKWQVNMGITGTLDSLKYDLSSSPVLDSNNILSLLMIGRTAGESLNYSPAAILSQVVALNYSGEIKKRTGIDTFEIKTPVSDLSSYASTASTVSNKSYDTGQVVTIGKNLDKRISFYYSIGTDSYQDKTGSTVKYKLNDSILLFLKYDAQGKVGMDVRYSKEFR